MSLTGHFLLVLRKSQVMNQGQTVFYYFFYLHTKQIRLLPPIQYFIVYMQPF